MSRMLTSIFMIGSIGYFVFRYRYRLMNLLFSSGWLRRIAVSSVMSMPGVKQKLMQTVFGGPSAR
ncbi:sodium:proton antiporter [Bacillus sp. FJAT-29814]|uniref:sodium:proton antiporter n=1 Tax=Bacillus sp. FJAT-29814 TaxID=1729688 RepID=UPI00082F3512|nr:sodium:proton antiporter [Bacillus sp. FJAT-29814]